MDEFLKIHLRNSNSYEELTRSLESFQVDSPATVTALDTIADRVNSFYQTIHASYHDPIFEAAHPDVFSRITDVAPEQGPPDSGDRTGRARHVTPTSSDGVRRILYAPAAPGPSAPGTALVPAPSPPPASSVEVKQWDKWRDWVEKTSGVHTDRPYLEVASRAYIPSVRLIEAWLLNPIGILPLSVDILRYEIEAILDPFDRDCPPPPRT